ncbi:MAG: hypothetical protein V4619_12200 [Bacteroidota bacterium]
MEADTGRALALAQAATNAVRSISGQRGPAYTSGETPLLCTLSNKKQKQYFYCHGYS